MVNDASTLLDSVRITGNRVFAQSVTASLRGGGIWNGAIQGVQPNPPSRLALVASQVTGNVITGPLAATLQGGGIYTEVPVALLSSRIARNQPDQCFGC
jgi:hypothetical protein